MRAARFGTVRALGAFMDRRGAGDMMLLGVATRAAGLARAPFTNLLVSDGGGGGGGGLFGGDADDAARNGPRVRGGGLSGLQRNRLATGDTVAARISDGRAGRHGRAGTPPSPDLFKDEKNRQTQRHHETEHDLERHRPPSSRWRRLTGART
jgi:hypothetical protein